MRSTWILGGVLAGSLALGLHAAGAGGRDGREAGGGGKALTVGAGGLKIDGTVAATDPQVPVTVNGKELARLPAKMYSVQLTGGKRYTITMDAANMKELDCVLILQSKDGTQLAFDDDGGGGLNSKIVFSAPKDDTYKIFAAALQGAGAFTLKVVESGAAGGGDPKKVHEVGAAGLSIDGSLAADSKAIVYQVKLAEGKTYRIDLVSKAFDCFLVLQDGEGKKLAEDDDGGDGLNSRIVFRAPSSGTYRIIATSLGMLGTGNFVLQVKEQ